MGKENFNRNLALGAGLTSFALLAHGCGQVQEINKTNAAIKLEAAVVIPGGYEDYSPEAYIQIDRIVTQIKEGKSIGEVSGQLNSPVFDQDADQQLIVKVRERYIGQRSVDLDVPTRAAITSSELLAGILLAGLSSLYFTTPKKTEP
jgi:hypothetical protein